MLFKCHSVNSKGLFEWDEISIDRKNGQSIIYLYTQIYLIKKNRIIQSFDKK